MYLSLLTVLATVSLSQSHTTSDQANPRKRATLDWTTAVAKANASLAKLSASDKIGIVSGVGWNKGPCVGNTHTATSINFPSLCLQDSPLGVRYGKSVTAFTPGIQAGATWDTNLMFQRGAALGAEAKGVGVHVILGPVAGPLGKIPEGGRNWEGFGADPYLSGIGMTETIEGIQSSGTQACAKHFILYEQELGRSTMSSNIDDRTLHELYLFPFADAVKANVASVMCSYNKVNTSWACEDSHTLNYLLKTELNFQGYVVSDWDAQHTTTGSALGGLDMAMPGSNFDGTGDIFWMQNLQQAINQGQVPQSRVDDMVRRILASWYLLGQDTGYPTVDLTRKVQGTHKDVVRSVARDGIVLLKNGNKALPLTNPGKLAIIGSAAVVNPQGMNACADRGCDTGALGMGWGSGTTDYPYFVAPYNAIQANTSNTVLSATDDATQGASAAQAASTAIVFLTADSGEGYITVEGNNGDRNNLDPWHNGNALVTAVANTGKPTIVVVHSVGPVILETILAQPNVLAVVWAGLPSQESGNALVDILFGSTSPSGKLPYTIAKAAQDYGTQVVNGDDSYQEGLYIDYRHFDKNNIVPRYEFGFGLSYTTFSYSSLAIQKASNFTSGPASTIIAPGGPSNHYDTAATVTATISNSGSVTGAEAAQLYIGFPSSAPDMPVRQLRGFTKLSLSPGARGTATFTLRRKDLSYWDVASQNWIVPSGTFTVYIGASSRDLRLQGALVV